MAEDLDLPPPPGVHTAAPDFDLPPPPGASSSSKSAAPELTTASNPFLLRAQRFGLQTVTVSDAGSAPSKAETPASPKQAAVSKFGAGPPPAGGSKPAAAASASSGGAAASSSGGIKSNLEEALSRPAFPFAGTSATKSGPAEEPSKAAQAAARFESSPLALAAAAARAKKGQIDVTKVGAKPAEAAPSASSYNAPLPSKSETKAAASFASAANKNDSSASKAGAKSKVPEPDLSPPPAAPDDDPDLPPAPEGVSSGGSSSSKAANPLANKKPQLGAGGMVLKKDRKQRRDSSEDDAKAPAPSYEGKTCNFCNGPLQKGKQVLEAGDLVFHPECMVCYGCRRPLTGEMLMVNNNFYHPACLVCGQCNCSLMGQQFSFNKNDGKLYCVPHSKREQAGAGAGAPSRPVPSKPAAASAAPKPDPALEALASQTCAGCKRPLVLPAAGGKSSQVVTANDQKFHKECFVCVKCGTELYGKPCFAKDDQAYCERDYHDVFGVKCTKCRKVIEGECLEVPSGGDTLVFHPACFTCTKCRKSMRGQPFFADGEKIYCEADVPNN